MFKFAMVACLTAGVILAEEESADKRLQNASAVVQEMMGMPDKGVPQDLLNKARCVILESTAGERGAANHGLKVRWRVQTSPTSQWRVNFNSFFRFRGWRT